MWLPEGTTVAMLQDRFASAMTLDEFIERAEANRDLWLAIRRRAQAPADLVERLRSLPPRRHLLVLAEDWCGDAVNTLPPLARLVEAVPQLDLRVLERDQNLDLMDTPPHWNCTCHSGGDDSGRRVSGTRMVGMPA